VNINEIKELINIITKNKIEEFELERAGMKIRIRSHISEISQNQELKQPKPSQEDIAIEQKVEESAAAKEEEKQKGREEYLEYITSPIVGTFYRAANPNAPSFCEIGDRIKSGQILCIIEAMKLMNEIVADRAGEIEEIYPENGQAVEYGEKLFALKPD